MTKTEIKAAPTFTKAELTTALTNAQVAIPRKANHAKLTELYEAHFASLAASEGPLPDLQIGEAVLFTESTPSELAAYTPEEWSALSGEQVADANCPHCGVHLSNGLLHMQDEALHEGGSYTPSRTLYEDGQQNHTWSCMGCGEGFGELHDPYVAPVPATGIKIEKERPEQNGVKRPSIGGKCRAIWDALDEYRAETGELPTSKTVKELAADSGWNPNNASIEYYQWRKFNGIAKG